MKNLLLLCFFTLLYTCVRAQQTASNDLPDLVITGQLLDGSTNEPLSFANVSLYTTADQLVKGTSTDIDGRYQLSGLAAGTYRLEASFLGYANQSQSVTLNPDKPEVELPPISLREGGNDLAEVTVTAERAVMELGLDRKVFNVEKSIAAAGGNAEDLLREIPSVTVDLDGNVSLRVPTASAFSSTGSPAR